MNDRHHEFKTKLCCWPGVKPDFEEKFNQKKIFIFIQPAQAYFLGRSLFYYTIIPYEGDWLAFFRPI
jgi:hypothetical protein